MYDPLKPLPVETEFNFVFVASWRIKALAYAAKPNTILSADNPNAFKNVTEPSL